MNLYQQGTFPVKDEQTPPEKQNWRCAFNGGLDVAAIRLDAARAMIAALAQPYHDQTINDMEHRLSARTMMEALCGIGEFLDQAKTGLDAMASAYEDTHLRRT